MAADNLTPETQERAAITGMLARIKSLHAQLQQAVGPSAGSSADNRLAAIIAHLAGAESQLTQALDGSGRSLLTIDLAAFAAMIQGSEAAAADAVLAAAAEASSRAQQELAKTSAATRGEVENLSRDLFGRRIFDPFLRFASTEDEEEFRAREVERQRGIAAQLAKHTPQGDLMAGGLAAGQMLDAHAHGAGASPEFQSRWDSLLGTLQKQRQAMLAAGQSVEAFDTMLAGEVRRCLRKDGLSEAEIDARLAATTSPLQAAQLYLSNRPDEHQPAPRGQHIPEPQGVSGLGIQIVAMDESHPPQPVGAIDFGAMTAKLQAAGVEMEPEAPAPASGHGVTIAELAPKPGSRIVI